MADLKIPKKTLQDNFDLTDFQSDFLALDEQATQMKAILDTWEAFKNNGGAIGNANTTDLGGGESNTNLSMLGYIRTRGVISAKDDNFWVDGKVLPWHNDIKTLGDANNRWKDIYLSGMSKDSNGYTKLPNGMIMQWGTFRRHGAEARVFEIYPKYPIQFPNTCLTFIGTVGVEDAYTNTRQCSYYAIGNNNNSFKIRSYATGDYSETVETAYIQWMAIGY